MLTAQSWDTLPVQRKVRVSYGKNYMTLKISVIDIELNLIVQRARP